MRVWAYKYSLQWLYCRGVSSDINARFCAYCLHSTGIDTPLQKMHDDEDSKADMRLVVEEVEGASVGDVLGNSVLCGSLQDWCFWGPSKSWSVPGVCDPWSSIIVCKLTLTVSVDCVV